MPSGFVATSLSVDQLFREPAALLVPDYQRPYSWTTREAQQLLDDLMLAMSESRSVDGSDGGYFLGTMLLMDRSGADNGAGTPARAEMDIVDGQQRTITLTILFAVLRDLVADQGGSISALVDPLLWYSGGAAAAPAPRVRLRGREQDFFLAHVQEDDASWRMPESDDLTASEARILAVREHLVEGLIDLAAAEVEALAHYLVKACHFAVITTRTIDRAHRIFAVLNDRGRPLARNDILKAQILGGIPQDRRDGYVPRWDRIEQRLGGDFEGLFGHIRAIEGLNRERVITGITSIARASGGPQAFFDDVLAPYAEIYEAMQMRPTTADPASVRVGQYLTYLGWLGSEDWMPAMMLHWQKCRGTPAELEDFAQRLDRLAYGLRLLGLGADKRLARFSAVLAAVRSGTWRNPTDSPFELVRDELRNIHYNFRNLHGRSQLTCKLILLRLNDLIAGSPQGLDPSDYTVEHVLPQKPGRASIWRTFFPSADEREECTQSIGNLVLVTRSQNDRARNLDLDRKLEVYFADGVDKALAITRDLHGVTEWRAEHVRAREQRLFALVLKLWSLDAVRSDGKPPDGRVGRRRKRV